MSFTSISQTTESTFTINTNTKVALTDFQQTPIDIVINTNVRIDSVWNLQGKTLLFQTGGHISGTGTINGGVIQAYLKQDLFDTTIKLTNIDVYGKDFSVMWYGAKSSNLNNTINIQKSIDACISNRIKNCFVPSGVYHTQSSINICNLYKNQYVAASIHLYGESEFWDARTIIILDNPTVMYCLGIQVGKGTEIDHLQLLGQFRAPVTTDSIYYNTSLEAFGTSTLTCGLIVDYDGTKNSSGSTGLKIHDMWIGNFRTLISISPNGVTFNAEILTIENIHLGDARIGIQTGQAQEKANVLRGIWSWGNIHTLIQIGQNGKFQAGNYIIDVLNVAGHCIRLFDIRQGGWYSSSISHVFAESIATIGNLSTCDSKTCPPLSITNSTFHFVLPSIIGVQNLLQSNTTYIEFSYCTFRYYGASDALKMTGYFSLHDCTVSGGINNITLNGVSYK